MNIFLELLCGRGQSRKSSYAIRSLRKCCDTIRAGDMLEMSALGGGPTLRRICRRKADMSSDCFSEHLQNSLTCCALMWHRLLLSRDAHLHVVEHPLLSLPSKVGIRFQRPPAPAPLLGLRMTWLGQVRSCQPILISDRSSEPPICALKTATERARALIIERHSLFLPQMRWGRT